MDEHPYFYVVLGVPPTATQAEITHAFRAKLRALHPDTRAAGVDDIELRHLLGAYAVLREPSRRAEYDRTARGARRPSQPIEVSVTHAPRRDAAPRPRSPLWAGPVRWHR
jgi:curved DNA-binding protein CbpA